jgi:putative phage-type endonuclease
MTTNNVSSLTPMSASVIRVSENTAARFVANYENGSDDWHDLRATGIGGSEVGAICGLNRWESAFSLWAKKTGQIADTFTGNEATEWGNRLEPVIIDKFADEHPELVVHENVGTWAHPEREWQLANPDAIFETLDGEFGIIEVKTAQFEDDWNPIPPSYRAQVQWYLSLIHI